MLWLLSFGFFLGALKTHGIVNKVLIVLAVLSLCIAIHAASRKR